MIKRAAFAATNAGYSAIEMILRIDQTEDVHGCGGRTWDSTKRDVN